MIKAVKINEEKELTLSNNLAWATIYKDQFGHDIVPDIMPVLSAVLRLMGELSDAKDIFKVDPDTLQDALMDMCAIQFVDFIHLVWAFNKAYDDTIEPPEKWVRQFDEFPMDIIAPAVFELLTKGLVSSKNLQSLQKMKAKQ